MRARICSALSCDMFARVVWLRLRRARDSRLSLCHLPHALATHYFLRLTRARGVSSQREGNALFADFWYFWSRKSTIKEKLFYVSSRANNVRPYHDPKSRQQPKQEIKSFIRFFFCRSRRKRESYQKENADIDVSRSAECLPSLGDADTHAPRMCQFPPLSVDDTAF